MHGVMAWWGEGDFLFWSVGLAWSGLFLWIINTTVHVNKVAVTIDLNSSACMLCMFWLLLWILDVMFLQLQAQTSSSSICKIYCICFGVPFQISEKYYKQQCFGWWAKLKQWKHLFKKSYKKSESQEKWERWELCKLLAFTQRSQRGLSSQHLELLAQLLWSVLFLFGNCLEILGAEVLWHQCHIEGLEGFHP